MGKQANEVRNEVSKAYAERVNKPSGSCCGKTEDQKGFTAALGIYSKKELETVPTEAQIS